MGTYPEQFGRLKRSYSRFKDIDDGRTHSRESDHYTDDMYNFFMNCHHMKDWLKNDPNFLAGDSEVEEYINNNRALCLAADICNSQKHLQLRSKRSDENPTLGQRINQLWLGAGSHKIVVKFTIDTKNGPLDAFTLATECLDLWTQFIEKNKACD